MPCRARMGSGPSPMRPNVRGTSPDTLPILHRPCPMNRYYTLGVFAEKAHHGGRVRERSAPRTTEDPQPSQDPKRSLLYLEERMSLAVTSSRMPTMEDPLPLVIVPRGEERRH